MSLVRKKRRRSFRDRIPSLARRKCRFPHCPFTARSVAGRKRHEAEHPWTPPPEPPNTKPTRSEHKLLAYIRDLSTDEYGPSVEHLIAATDEGRKLIEKFVAGLRKKGHLTVSRKLGVRLTDSGRKLV